MKKPLEELTKEEILKLLLGLPKKDIRWASVMHLTRSLDLPKYCLFNAKNNRNGLPTKHVKKIKSFIQQHNLY